MQPRIVVDLKKFRKNARVMFDMCHQNGISASAVTKVFCASKPLVEALIEEGADFLADSRLKNISEYPKTSIKKILLRLPSIDEAEETVRLCDISLNSEALTMRSLADAAKSQGKRHGIVLMVDVGDLREGMYWKNIDLISNSAEYASKEPWLDLIGIGVNLTCYGSIIPSEENLGRLCAVATELESRLGIVLPHISGGNSSSIHLLLSGRMPKKISNLRLGEAIARGCETAYSKPIDGLDQDLALLEAQLIEIQEKPSYPEGDIGLNAFGEKPSFEDKGRRKRGVLAIGRQDTDSSGISCATPGVFILGASSDHLIVDLTEAEKVFKIGDILRFKMNYSAILRGFTSRYVDKAFI
ncbi:MAG: alanine/ornithine racemase family PLP-dependent enzyme [Clostridiales bacterium]|jgi:predicted amino acid racemase|nr:alanine/ornithine racemase family PLP-dependent enzyme [Clostridiales bacterium]